VQTTSNWGTQVRPSGAPKQAAEAMSSSRGEPPAAHTRGVKIPPSGFAFASYVSRLGVYGIESFALGRYTRSLNESGR
jgi:hypothetical protein